MIGKKTIDKETLRLQDELKEELRAQGHYLTGALERSIDSKFVDQGDTIAREIVANDYAETLNTGIPSSKININDAGYIAGLTRYAEQRFGYFGEQAKTVAFQIAAKHKKEGMPTKNSYQYSENNRRTHAIDVSVENNLETDRLMESGLSQEIDEVFNFPDLTIL